MEWVKIFTSGAEMREALVDRRPRLLIVEGKRICLLRDGDRLLAVEDTCPHNGESLSKGHVNYVGEIVCPWHGQRFNLKTGREASQQSRDLEVYPVREDGQGVFIGI